MNNKCIKGESCIHCNTNYCRFVDELRELEQENAELKAENERLKEKIESYVCSQNCYAYKQADKYRQTLQEIKAIAEQSNVDCIYRISVIRKILTKAEEE